MGSYQFAVHRIRADDRSYSLFPEEDEGSFLFTEVEEDRSLEWERHVSWPEAAALSQWQESVPEKRSFEYGTLAQTEYKKQYSLLYYWWMKELAEVTDDELLSIIQSDTYRWAAEHVFKVPYREFEYALLDGQLVSPDFGNRSILSMCAEAVEIRIQAGASTERADHEGLGVANLQKLLSRMKPGETAVIISPPDGAQEKSASYNMIYLYEKRGDNTVKATAVRDTESTLTGLRALAGYLSGNMPRWENATHLEMVAVPFVSRVGFDALLDELGVHVIEYLPGWATEMIDKTTRAMWRSIQKGDRTGATELFDALQIALFTRYKNEQDWSISPASRTFNYDPLVMVADRSSWMDVQAEFVRVGGLDMMEEADQCGGVALSLKDFTSVNNLQSVLFGYDEVRVPAVAGEIVDKTVDGDKSVVLDGTTYTLTEIVNGGEKECYNCPVCRGETKGNVYSFKGFLVCTEIPETHHIKKS